MELMWCVVFGCLVSGMIGVGCMVRVRCGLNWKVWLMWCVVFE